MALKTTVKISKVNNLSDARYCAGMGVKMIGFVLDPSNPNAIDTEKFNAITEWLEGVEYVGEFYNSSANEILETLKSYKVNYIQITNEKLIPQLEQDNIILRIDSFEGLKNFIAYHTDTRVSYILLENSEITKLSEKEAQLIAKAGRQYPLILGCGLNVDNVENLLSSLSLTGISLQGGNEISPGMADLDELADMLELLEVED